MSHAAEKIKLERDPEILPTPICIACHEPIWHARSYFALSLGIEDAKRPIGQQIWRTGMIWHQECLDYQNLPGCVGRDDPLEDEKERRAKIVNGRRRKAEK